MRLYSGKITTIAAEVVRSLVSAEDIEATKPKEVEADIAAVLNQYLSDEREVNERAKDVLQKTGKPQTEYQRVRKLVADEKGIKVGEDTLDAGAALGFDFIADTITVENLGHDSQGSGRGWAGVFTRRAISRPNRLKCLMFQV